MASGIRGAGAVKLELNSVNADKFKLTAIIKHVLSFFFYSFFESSQGCGITSKYFNQQYELLFDPVKILNNFNIK